MMNSNIDQALQQLKQAQNDPQALTITTAQIACAPLHSDLFDILQVAAIPHWFDADILATLLQIDIDKANDWLQLLIKLPMVESYTARQAWNVHEATRLTIRTILANCNSERFRTLTSLSANYFSGSEKFQKNESIYHRLANNETGADRKLLDLYHHWRRSGQYDTQQALALLLEELLNNNLLKGLALARCMVVRGWIRGTRLSTTLTDKQARQSLALFIKAGDEYGQADSRQWLGRVLQTEGKLKEALHEFLTSMDIMLRLTQHSPDNDDWLLDLSVLHSNVGRVLQAQGDLTSALQANQNSMNIRRRLTARDPNNSDWQLDLAVSHNYIGAILQAQGNLDSALQEYQSYQAIMRSLTERNPHNNYWLRELSVSHNNIGSILLLQDHLAEALHAYQASMDIRKHLTELDPDNNNWKRDLSFSYAYIGKILQAQNDYSDALQAYQAFKSIMQRLTECDPNNKDWQRDLSVAHNCVGRILQAQGDLNAALLEYQASMQIMQHLSEKYPDNTVWLRDLSVAHTDTGNILQAQGNLAEALKQRIISFTIMEHLVQQDATNVLWQQDLQVSRQALSALKQRITEAENPQTHQLPGATP